MLHVSSQVKLEPCADLVCWLGAWLSNNLPLLVHDLCCQQAENVLALVNARTAAAADSALAGLQGGLGQLVAELRGDVLDILTELEARLDFDEDLPPLDVDDLVQDITGETLTAWLAIYACHCDPVRMLFEGRVVTGDTFAAGRYPWFFLESCLGPVCRVATCACTTSGWFTMSGYNCVH